ncbi:MAG: helix-hairpin-helix domain-containing protein [Bacillota bacterium]
MFKFSRREEMIIAVIIITIVVGSGKLVVDHWQSSNTGANKFVADAASESEEDKVSQSESKEQATTSQTAKQILVQIGGAVNRPGVYRLSTGARVFELIERAQGATNQADLDQLNLVDQLRDGEKIIVPTKDTASAANNLAREDKSSTASDTKGQSSRGLINLNTATKSELEQLYRIGPATAEKILRYRQQQGSFQTISELKQISGIGEKTYQQNKDRLTVQ